MSIASGRDVLFFPRVVRSTNAAAGVNYGILCLTHQNLYYVPRQVVELRRDQALTESYAVTSQKTAHYDGKQLEDVVPSLMEELDSSAELDRFLTDMAARVSGSCVIPVAEIERFKVGYFAQLSVFRGSHKERFTIGGRRHREAAQAFVKEQLGRTA